MSEGTAIMYIPPEWLEPQNIVPFVYGNTTQAWYWSDLWDSSFYVALARAGFISICNDFYDDRMLLLPQMHIESAMLEWPNRHISRSLCAYIRSGKAASLGLTLRITQDLDTVMDCLGECWATDSWLYPPYRHIMNELSSKSKDHIQNVYSAGDPDLIPLGIELWSTGCDRPIAGELGYVTGSVYTSLSGFMHPDRSRWNNTGKLQLQALAIILEHTGFSFWNLGQPQMQYKMDLGAQVAPRSVFLGRWLPSVSKPVPLAFYELLDKSISVDPLLQAAINSAPQG